MMWRLSPTHGALTPRFTRIMARPLQAYEIDDIIGTVLPAVCRHTGVCLRGLTLVFEVRQVTP